MPFDPLPAESTPVTVPDESRERLAMLRDMLRGPRPDGHVWDFGTILKQTSCGTIGCALGEWFLRTGRLTGWVLLEGIRAIPCQDAAEEFGLTADQALYIFYLADDRRSISPLIVADRITAVLAEGS